MQGAKRPEASAKDQVHVRCPFVRERREGIRKQLAVPLAGGDEKEAAASSPPHDRSDRRLTDADGQLVKPAECATCPDCGLRVDLGGLVVRGDEFGLRGLGVPLTSLAGLAGADPGTGRAAGDHLRVAGTCPERPLMQAAARGSTPDPVRGDTPRCSAYIEPLGAIAQLGERLLCKQEVTGSIPVGSIRHTFIGVVARVAMVRRRHLSSRALRLESGRAREGRRDCCSSS